MISSGLVPSRRSLIPFAGLLLALLGCSCMWGVVRDASTGAPLRGATVTYRDANGATATTTTDLNGLFGFGAPVSAAPARGPVSFQVDAPGYPTLSETRDVLYDDNPNAGLQNMSTFWDVQVFGLVPPANRHHNDKGGYSTTFPDDWDITEAGGTGTYAVARPTSPDAPAMCEMFSFEDPDQDYAEEFLRTYIIIMREATDFQQIERSQGQLNLIPAVRVVYSYKSSTNPQAGTSFKDLAYVMEWNGRGYAIDCVTTSQRFNRLQQRFEDIAKTFAID
jgi:hypothetical protein